MEEKKISQRPITGRAYSIIDVEKNPNKNLRVSSPKSLKAMQQLGYTNQDLDYISFSDFLNSNPDLANSKAEIQKKRYEYLENIRKERIEEIKSVRETISRINSKKKTNENYQPSYIPMINSNINSNYSNTNYNNYNNTYNNFSNSNNNFIDSNNNYSHNNNSNNNYSNNNYTNIN